MADLMWKQVGERVSVVAKEADEQEVTRYMQMLADREMWRQRGERFSVVTK